MKTIYNKPTIQCVVLASRLVMCNSSEIEITDDPVDPRGSGANSHRGGSWGDFWGDGSDE